MELRGVRVHNLRGIDVTIPWGQLTVISGVSGSGKSSLAFDTLYAEGQRRYLESLSPQARQLLEQLPQPEADWIDPLPPAIAVPQTTPTAGPRSTVGTATEIAHYLRLLFAKVGQIVCPACRHPVRKQTPQDVLKNIQRMEEGRRFQIAFPLDGPTEAEETISTVWDSLREQGFTRGIINHRTVPLQSEALPDVETIEHALVIVDRLSAGKATEERILDSLEVAFAAGSGRCVLLCDDAQAEENAFAVDEKPWRIERYSDRLQCETCRREFPELVPRLFNPNSPLGACPECEGLGTVWEFSLEQLVPDYSLTLEAGALACFREAPLAEGSAEFLQAAQNAGIPLDVPFEDLTAEQKHLLIAGDSQKDFAGLKALIEDLKQQPQRSAPQSFLQRWEIQTPCPACAGQKLQPGALAVRIGEVNIAEVNRRPLMQFRDWLESLPETLTKAEQKLMQVTLAELQSRAEALTASGLEYLSLDRPLTRLSTGEMQRVALARILGNPLVNSLYVVDEPSTGLHPADCQRVAEMLRQIQQAENTVVVVEHEEEFLRRADFLVDLGPGAGRDGGEVVFQGPPAEIGNIAASRTGQYLSGAAAVERPHRPPSLKEPPRLTLHGARQYPLKTLTVKFPLNCLCVITGVSGSSKSVLLEQTLYPALQETLGQPLPRDVRTRFDRLEGGEAIDEVVLLDQAPLGGSTRSNPVTYLNAFDNIRRIFAESPEANRLGFRLKDFSFNSPSGGRCPECAGQGLVQVEMQFLPDLQMVCPECQGTRYRREILNVRYRGLHIAEVLDLTVAEAFTFFRTHPRLQRPLQVLKDVGLDYLPLGQPTAALSGGESQRLKLASFLTEKTPARTVFLLDEPTRGLHPGDIQTLLDCFDHLLAVGHSVIVAEHNLHFLSQADWVIDLGPGAAAEGGEILAEGPPAQIAENPRSLTGQWLAQWQLHKTRSAKA